MIDDAMRQQLTEVLADLPADVSLVIAPCEHESQADLRELVEALAACSPRLSVHEAGHPSPVPHLTLVVGGSPTGVSFRGVPGGHEFTSLVLAVLHSVGRGRMPDESVQARMRALRGPLRLRTFVSLECTNCPDVVQALNLITLLHDDCEHEMWDGALAPTEVQRLGVQGVPAVFAGDRLIHVGKADLAGLLDVLEEQFGMDEPATAAETVTADLAVVGGGPAGVAAAIYSARKGLDTVLVAGRIGGQLMDTLGIENLIARDYTEGPQLADYLRRNLESAGVRVLENRIVQELVDGESKALVLKGGQRVKVEQVIIATGAKWRELGVPGEKEHIGRGVAFCPHCDGPFYKGRRVAVVGGGNSGVEAAIDLAGICSQVTLLEFGGELRADAVLQRKLRSLPNVSIIVSARTTEVMGQPGGSGIKGLRYEDRTSGAIQEIELDGVFVQIGLVPNSAPFRELLEVNKAGEILVDSHGRTSRPGIYAAGDVASTPYKQIVIAMGDGAKVALAAFEDRMRREQPLARAS